MKVDHKDIIITDPCYFMPDCPVASDYNFPLNKPVETFTEEEQEAYIKYSNALEEYNAKMKVRDDWEVCDGGLKMNRLGFTDYISESTIIGDWCWTVESKGKVIGQYSADAGMCGVYLLEDVYRYNPALKEKFLKYPHICCIIRDFTGNVHFDTLSYGNNESIRIVIGNGNINFKSIPV